MGDKRYLSLEIENEGRGHEIREGEEVVIICDSLLAPLMKHNDQNPICDPVGITAGERALKLSLMNGLVDNDFLL